MSLEGMDVDQAQGLARRLEANARALANVAAALAGLTAELSHYWRGPASATFQQQWATRHRPALSNAAQSLADMHARLVANVQQQIRASATDPSPGQAAGVIGGVTLTALLSGASRVWDKANHYESLLTTPLDKIKEVAGNDDVAGRYNKTWTQLMKLDHDSPLLKYKRSPVLHWLHDNPQVKQVGHLLSGTHATAVLDKLDKVGKVMGIVTVTADVGKGGADILHHQYASAGGEVVNATSDGLKGMKNPVAYFAGGTVALLKEDYDLGSSIEWKQGIPNPFNADNFRNDYLPTFESMPGQMAGILEKAYL
jgi:uncharacterized protein YukE